MPITEPASDAEPSEPGRLRTVSMMLIRDCLARSSSATPPCCRTFATPQSTTSTSPKAPTMMLAGLRSRWITPREWA